MPSTPRHEPLRWRLARATAGHHALPAALDDVALDWVEADVPGTAASAWRSAGRWDDERDIDFDDFDWWFRSSFDAQPGGGRLTVGGLATIADVWLNGELVLHSENMFHEHDLDVVLADHNELVVCCRSLAQHLERRRPRPRWKTRLVERQQLRWARTTLLGRMPSWTPPAAPVGIWRELHIRSSTPDHVTVTRLSARLLDDVAGDGIRSSAAITRGVVDFDGWVPDVDGTPVSAWLRVGDERAALAVSAETGRWRLTGEVHVTDPPLWWPHTHGEPLLSTAHLELSRGDTTVTVSAGAVGFRTVHLDRHDDGFRLVVNGVATFCRGACWVPLDVISLNQPDAALRGALEQMVAAGMNMVRITGTMAYETAAFHELCDELGLLVWQDMMFANMDYPTADDAFADSVTTEIRTVLTRLRNHPSTAVLCGGSEVEQQAAMMGLADADAVDAVGRALIPPLAAELLPDVPYVANSPSGGVHPFSINAGVSHYYGVGAYLRPFDDARRADVRFTSECLAFANVPCRQSVDEFLRDGERPGHSPRWKARVPRDRGAGWDFEDVRDHYVRSVFDVDPMAVRYADSDRYLDLGRAVVCVAMEAAASEWRRPGSRCGGNLVFTLRDLWAGAGWGVIDAAGRPKSAYYALQRANTARTVLVVDEGLNGVVAHVVNDAAEPFAGELRLSVYGPEGLIDERASAVTVGAAGGVSLSVDGVFGAFRDLNYAYRFGPARYDLLGWQLADESATVVARGAHLLRGHRNVVPGHGLRANFDVVDGATVVDVSSDGFAHFVSIDVTGGTCADNWFHLLPDEHRRIECALDPASRRTGEVHALNLPGGVTIGPPPD